VIVWVVHESNYDGGQVFGVYSSKKKAERMAEIKNAGVYSGSGYHYTAIRCVVH
jgi:hypothetical protein